MKFPSISCLQLHIGTVITQSVYGFSAHRMGLHFDTTVVGNKYSFSYHNSTHYPLSWLLFKTQRFGDGFCLRLQVEPTQLGSIDWIMSPSSGPPEKETISIY
jgi:hypothetical protein